MRRKKRAFQWKDRPPNDDGDFLRSVAEAVLQLIMEADVEGVIGAGRHERAEGRTTWRGRLPRPAARHPARNAEAARAQAAAGLVFPRLHGAAADLGE